MFPSISRASFKASPLVDASKGSPLLAHFAPFEGSSDNSDTSPELDSWSQYSKNEYDKLQLASAAERLKALLEHEQKTSDALELSDKNAVEALKLSKKRVADAVRLCEEKAATLASLNRAEALELSNKSEYKLIKALADNAEMLAALLLSSTALLEAQAEELRHKNAAALTQERFVRYVFHELRVPCHTICMSMDVLSSEAHLTPAGRETLTMLDSACNSMKDVINDTLDFAKVESGSFQIRPMPASLGGVIRDSLFMLHPFSQEAAVRVAITSSIDPGLDGPLLLLDGKRLKQVFANLLSNAVKFAPHDGSGKIHLGASIAGPGQADPGAMGVVWSRKSAAASGLNAQGGVEAEGAGAAVGVDLAALLPGGSEAVTVVSTIRDNGSGVAPGDFSSLFEPFRQLETGLTVTQSGSGLGLSIVQEIVMLHGGMVGVRDTSQTGGGAEFVVLLRVPRAGSDAVAAAQPQQSLQQHHRMQQRMHQQQQQQEMEKGRQHEPFSSAQPGSVESLASLALVAAVPPSPSPSPSPAPSLALSLPLADLASPRCDSQARADGLQQGPVQSFPRLCLLIVDDVPSNRKLLRHLLQVHFNKMFGAEGPGHFETETGQRVRIEEIAFTEAADGHLALREMLGEDQIDDECIRTATLPRDLVVAPAALRRFDCITMDAQMPTLNGFETTRMLRAAGYSGPIFGVTGNNLHADQELFLSCGVDEIFIKPVMVAQMLEALVESVVAFWEGSGKTSRVWGDGGGGSKAGQLLTLPANAWDDQRPLDHTEWGI